MVWPKGKRSPGECVLESSEDDWSSSLAFIAGLNESLAVRFPQPGEKAAFKCAKEASLKEMRLTGT